MDLDNNIQDFKRAVQRSPLPTADQVESEGSPKVDSALSSIEKSKSVSVTAVPSMSVPHLTAPSADQVDFAAVSADARGKPIVIYLSHMVLREEGEIKNRVLDRWAENLREISEWVRQMLRSPLYQQLQEIRLQGNQGPEGISGVQKASSSPIGAAHQTAAPGDVLPFLSVIDHLRAIEHVPAAARIPDPSAPQDSSRALVIPLGIAILMGGGLIVGGTGAATHPLGQAVGLIEHLQPIFPQLAVQDLIPLLNLMVMGPIYYHSWNEMMKNPTAHEYQQYVKIIQQFAEDQLKLMADPMLVLALIKRMEGTRQLSPQDQMRLASFLKIILVGVALSLLYSVEVGKVHQGQFSGMEPEELRDLLKGDLAPQVDPHRQATRQEELTTRLIQQAHQELHSGVLSEADRLGAIHWVLDYIGKTRELNQMLDPAKVFDEILASSSYQTHDKVNILKV